MSCNFEHFWTIDIALMWPDWNENLVNSNNSQYNTTSQLEDNDYDKQSYGKWNRKP